jgi:hypothetical protein
MILYHGTDRIIETIDLTKSRLRTDFGRGFYLSDKIGNARSWSIDKSGVLGRPTVMRYEIDNSIQNAPELKVLRFESPTIAWLNFVRDNRRRLSSGLSRQEPRHFYDVVSGPIANDKVAIAVDKYCRGLLTAEETLNEVRTIRDVFQMSLHTPSALAYIKSKACSQQTNKKWSPFSFFI